MPNQNASVEILDGKTYLILNEQSGSGSVEVTLKKGAETSGVYSGILTYQDQNIDVVQARFDAGDNLDQVTLELKLIDDGNYYTFKSGTSVYATDSNGVELDYIQQSVKTSQGGTANDTLVFTYLEPPVDTHILKEVYFYTDQGIIDPEDDVEREPN